MWWLGLALVGTVTASIHDNAIGDPELGVLSPEDPASPNYNVLSPLPYSGGTYQFVSSSFPEIDSRGFHGGMFDGIGDYYPSWPSVYYKRFHKSDTKEADDIFRGSHRKKRSATYEKPQDAKSSTPIELDEKRKVEKRGRSGGRIVRGMEMGSSGFHGDVFNSGFGDFSTMKRRSYEPYKRSLKTLTSPISMNDEPAAQMSKTAKRRPEMDAMGFYGDTFGNGFGEFDIMKKRRPEMDAMGFHGDTFGGGFGDFETMKKRRPEMDAMGFHGDTFGGGFGDFETMKKRRPEMDAMGFHGDTFGNGFGEFDIMKKRRPEMDAMGFHGDTFGGGFGDFETMKKRRPEMDAMGFHGDTFGGGFGYFETMKKRRPEMDAMGFHGDTFGNGFGEFDIMKKRRPEMDAMGFHGDTFGGGFGDFETMKKRRPEMDAMGFHGDTFGGGFGDFETMKKRLQSLSHVNSTARKLEDLLTSNPAQHHKLWGNRDSQGTGRDSPSFHLGQRAHFKRRPELDNLAFRGSVLPQVIGSFELMKNPQFKQSRGL